MTTAVRLEDPGTTEGRLFAEEVAREIYVSVVLFLSQTLSALRPEDARPSSRRRRDVGLLMTSSASLVLRLLPLALRVPAFTEMVVSATVRATTTAMRFLLSALLDEACPPLPLDDASFLPAETSTFVS